MFQHFLKSLRDHHPIKVSLDMENIMSLVLQESDDIPPELLSPILHYVRKDAEVMIIRSSNAAALIARWRRQLQKENPLTPLTSPVPEHGDLSVTHQLAKLRQRIVDTLTSVRPFRSELDSKEQYILTSLRTVSVSDNMILGQERRYLELMIKFRLELKINKMDPSKVLS
ncbi:hypothetical protein F2Q70_00033376 [Brassica cretica]|uniref:Uncharacterized protein n=1 Tax=Brassica cretica TaxID=69181 RepID=A0A8S9FDS9_BRACR|nr:hypothetical protein F2Q70_00033376 [Brassica cretica]